MPPPTMITSAPGTSARLSRSAMHVLREHLHVLHRRRRQDPVPEIEDVSRTTGRAREHVFRLVEHPPRRAQEQGRIQVALHGAIETDLFPRLVNRNAPVDANHV